MLREIFLRIQKYERHLSALAMVAGFVVDSIFFERIDLWQTQAVFASYAAVCFISIPLLQWFETRAARGVPVPRWRLLLPLATQFALGGFWSGFVIFYGRSAVLGASWPFLLFIFLVFLGNEYFYRYHARLVFTSALFFFALYSYAIFALPMYTGTIGTLTFLASGVVAVGAFALFTALLRALARERFLSDVWHIRIGALTVLVIMNVFYFTNVLPPIPLAAKEAGIYHSVWRVPGAYLAKSEAQPWQVRYLGFAPTLRVTLGESVSAYSSVFAPTLLTTTIVHRWQWYDPRQKEWLTKSVIRYPIAGGRDGGYRGYSEVPMSTEGKWRVSVETADGRIIVRLPFIAEKTAVPPFKETIILK
ncbi:MAG: hypothetical protein UY89_C0018G0004 [Parcubacteria group bacterium GW2011_GWA1_54_9]|nr:MAG: hypothetical protein UY89_C0018G0004 [Parcubacteria group bacterium GW2011_GWA1_54_9]